MDEENTQQQTQTTDTGAQDTTQAHEQADTWADAEAAFLADKGVKKDETDAEKSNDDDAAANKGTDDASKSGGEEDPNKKSDDSEEELDPNKDQNLEQQDDQGEAYREARRVQREIEADNQAMRTDVKKELYSDWSDDILDADGEPIKTPRDVMSHINPATGKRFTEEEATAWLFAAQKHKDTQRAEMEQRVEHVAQVMIEQRDQADQVKSKYGKLLAQLPDLRKEIWADYKDTLVIDKESGLIVDAPVSLYKFFERALRPYEQYVQQIQADKTTQQKTQDDTTRRQTQQDREDITTTAGGSITDPEEEGWAKAAKEYYEG